MLLGMKVLNVILEEPEQPYCRCFLMGSRELLSSGKLGASGNTEGLSPKQRS